MLNLNHIAKNLQVLNLGSTKSCLVDLSEPEAIELIKSLVPKTQNLIRLSLPCDPQHSSVLFSEPAKAVAGAQNEITINRIDAEGK